MALTTKAQLEALHRGLSTMQAQAQTWVTSLDADKRRLESVEQSIGNGGSWPCVDAIYDAHEQARNFQTTLRKALADLDHRIWRLN